MVYTNLNMKALLVIQEALKRNYKVSIFSEEFAIYSLDIDGKIIHFRNSDCGLCSSFAYKICKSKIFSNLFFSSYGLPIPFYKTYSKTDVIDFSTITFPVVVKPDNQSCNRGVTVNVLTSQEMQNALNYAYSYSNKIIVQSYVEGTLYRVFVLGGSVVAVTKLEAPFVIGNNSSTIKQLIDIENSMSYRSHDKFSSAKPIIIEDQIITHLGKLGYSIDSVLHDGQKIFLRKNPEMALGGISTNIAFDIHNFSDCIKATELLHMPWAGIDIIAKDESFTDYSIIEVNSQPDFKMHMYPVYGEPINIASLLLDFIISSSVS
ncbi:MAG: hypothetical protein WCO66_03640 [Candidatus Absconditabacteria bacterium]